ncbi:MAG: putative lipoprotein [Paraglaciecola psychrophila]|jgi:uncharacterized lipoprotein
MSNRTLLRSRAQCALGLVLLLVTVACAYSPQQLTLRPTINSSLERYGNSRSLTIEVVDQRSDKTLGTRGGVYEQTSIITLANSLEQTIAQAATAQFASQGFVLNSLDGQPITVKIIIDKLSYDVPADSLVKKVLLAASLRVEASTAAATYQGQYQSESEHPTVVTPTMKKNEKIVNQLLSATLLRLFEDPKLKAFLSNS